MKLRPIKVLDAAMAGLPARLSESEASRYAGMLADSGVDVIEVRIGAVPTGGIASLAISCGCSVNEVRRAARALEGIKHPMLIVTASLGADLGERESIREEDLLADSVQDAVRLAKNLVESVQFCAQNAPESRFHHLLSVIELAVAEGAGTVCIADSTGFSSPLEFASLIKNLRAESSGLRLAQLSVRCSDSLGMAVANTLTGVACGASQIEANSIAGKGGMCPMQGVIDALGAKAIFCHANTRVQTQKLPAMPEPAREFVS